MGIRIKPPLMLIIGFIGAVMGFGGGFILIPIMIYLLRVPTSTVIGTSMVLTLVTMVFATMLHAVTNHLVDAVLALILMVGGVTGAQFGARAGQKIRDRKSTRLNSSHANISYAGFCLK